MQWACSTMTTPSLPLIPDSVGENRMVTLSMGLNLRVLYVVRVERHRNNYRIISARKASPGEIRQYQE